jgi:hypothetical protein
VKTREQTKQEKRPPGRPKTGKIRVQIKLSPRVFDLLKRRAAKLGISRSEYIERVVLEADNRWLL